MWSRGRFEGAREGARQGERERERDSVPCFFCIGAEWLLVEGYLAHKKTLNPLDPP